MNNGFVQDVIKPALRPYKAKVINSLNRDAAIRKGVPPIVFVTIPKSASVYINQKIMQILNIPSMHIIVGRFPALTIVPSWLKDFSKGGIVTQNHMPSSGHNLHYLKKYGIEKVVVNVRDPRQALLSWVHYIDKLYQADSPNAFKTDFLPPDGVRSDSLERRIDWQIDNYLPHLNQWLLDWMDVEESKRMDVLFVQYKQFNGNPGEFYKRIIDFYGVQELCAGIPETRKTIKGRNDHFRSGKTDEFRSVFSEKQMAKANAVIDARIFERFGWNK